MITYQIISKVPIKVTNSGFNYKEILVVLTVHKLTELDFWIN